MLIGLAVLVASVALAFANGANDNFKGVATLYGARRLSYRRALSLATATTLAGSLAALLLGAGLARRFSGKGLVPDSVVADPVFVLSVAVGAALTVLLASRLGLPVSTTHALTGALVGGGVAFSGAASVSYSALSSSFALPLLLSPALSLGLAVVVERALRLATGELEPACLCVASLEPVPLANGFGALNLDVAAQPVLGTLSNCERHGARRLATLDPGAAIDRLHLLSAGAVGFARGLNDTPKIAGLLLAASALAPSLGTGALAMAMALGGWAGARRVAQTLSFEITEMDVREGLSANLVTAGLVVFASPLGLPVSTTHVSCGALFGIGAAKGEVRWRTIASIAAAWGATLPAAALLSGLVSLALLAIR